ncbi:MAG: hypothetical protein IKA59_01000 [Clostridia bacterium]|nr:hypothetical protein [Clostridia bacterium]
MALTINILYKGEKGNVSSILNTNDKTKKRTNQGAFCFVDVLELINDKIDF